MSEELGFLEDGVQGFEPIEVEGVIATYVCAACHSSLLYFDIPNDRIKIIVCPEHGNVEKVGRVMKSTVSIELERGTHQYWEVVRNLPDIWGHLIQEHANPNVERLFREIDHARYEQGRKKKKQ